MRWGVAGVLYEAGTGVAPFGDEDDDFPSLERPAHPVARDRRLPAARRGRGFSARPHSAPR